MSIRRTLSLAGITIIDTGGAQSRRLYPITDHLGSTMAIADGTGHLVQGLAYADFGKRYSAGWTQSKGVKTSNIRFMDQANRIRARITAASGSIKQKRRRYPFLPRTRAAAAATPSPGRR